MYINTCILYSVFKGFENVLADREREREREVGLREDDR